LPRTTARPASLSRVISYDLWQRRFGGDPNIIGRKITLNNQPNEVIGVLPAEVGWYVQKAR
jgi:hypothetical protein